MDDFDEMDANGGGLVDFREFCEWVEAAEKMAGTPAGVELAAKQHLYQHSTSTSVFTPSRQNLHLNRPQRSRN